MKGENLFFSPAKTLLVHHRCRVIRRISLAKEMSIKRVVMLVMAIEFLSFTCPGYAADAVGPLAAFRTWTDVSGKYKLDAKLVDCEDGKVRRRRMGVKLACRLRS